MKAAILIAGIIILGAMGYYFLAPLPATAPETSPSNADAKIDINAVCEGALAYMSFQSGAEADAWVAACKRGEHPEAIEQWKQMNGFPTDSAAMRVEENMIVVFEQRPGSTVTASQVHMAAPGFVVIHEDNVGEPGTILGASALLQAGDSSNVRVTLSRAAREGEKLHAMLHVDANNNGKFDAASDTSVQSRLGGPISGWFDISSDASIETPIITI